jgi:hypothetical protein
MKAGVEKYFTIRANLSLSDQQKMKLQIQTVDVESKRDVLGTPVSTKEYAYVCDPLYEDCGEEGCTCNVVSVNESDGTKVFLMILSILSLMILFQRKTVVNKE